MQRAEKGVRFEKLPQVLILHLKRFSEVAKLNHELSFDATLELQPFMAEQSADGTAYELFAVIMHAGGVHSGHYWTYVRCVPGKASCHSTEQVEQMWLQFDDSQISKTTLAEVIRMGTGTGNDKDGSAYMLVYVQREILPATLQRPSSLEALSLKKQHEIAEVKRTLSGSS